LNGKIPCFPSKNTSYIVWQKKIGRKKERKENNYIKIFIPPLLLSAVNQRWYIAAGHDVTVCSKRICFDTKTYHFFYGWSCRTCVLQSLRQHARPSPVLS
jgi:hypothetical protein